MLDPTPRDFHREIDVLSQRLQALRLSLRKHGMVSEADQAVLDRVQREKDGLEVKLSAAESSGQWDTFKNEFAAVWNLFITDLEMLELRIMDNEMSKQKAENA
jgi:ABC-type phosphate transport system auxiliary subunit